MKDIETLHSRHPLQFIANYLGGYEDENDAYHLINIESSLHLALNGKRPKEWRALAAIDIWCAVHFCFDVEEKDKVPHIRVPAEVRRSAKRIALSHLLSRRMELFENENIEDLKSRKNFISEIIEDNAAAYLIYEYISNIDELRMSGYQMSAIELDDVFKEARRRLRAIWPYLDITLRFPLTPAVQSAKLPSIETAHHSLQDIYNDIPAKNREYKRHRISRDVFNHTISRSRPMFSFIYAIYGLGIYGKKILRFADADFCSNLIRFTTRPERLRYIAELYDDLRTLFPDSLKIEIPSEITRKQVLRRPLPEKITGYF